MAVMKAKDVRALSDEELQKKLEELKSEMLVGVENNPKKAGNIRKAIARIKTVLNERKTEVKKVG